MRYVKEIWRYFIQFKDEERFIKYKKMKRDKEELAFGELEDEVFVRLYNTFCWLSKFNSPTLRLSEDKKLTKPTNEEIVEALDYIHEEASDLLEFSKQYSDKEIRSGLRKKAKRELECVEYYKQLVAEDFYKDKEIKEVKGFRNKVC